MKITYRESGGFAGLVKGVEIDTSNLNHDEAQNVVKMVADSGIKGEVNLTSPAQRDVPQYDICIESENGVERRQLDFSHVTDDMKPLLKYLKRKSAIQQME